MASQVGVGVRDLVVVRWVEIWVVRGGGGVDIEVWR